LIIITIIFFCAVSDPAVGGTYMTLLNTLTNLGGRFHFAMSRAGFMDFMDGAPAPNPLSFGLLCEKYRNFGPANENSAPSAKLAMYFLFGTIVTDYKRIE
jgi:hypothetical protein